MKDTKDTYVHVADVAKVLGMTQQALMLIILTDGVPYQTGHDGIYLHEASLAPLFKECNVPALAKNEVTNV